MIGNWNRKLVLTIGPFPEWSQTSLGSEFSNSALTILSDGTQETLRVAFNIKTVMGYIAPASVISVYNLKAETRDKLYQKGLSVTLDVGYGSDGRLDQLYSGGLTSAVSHRDNTDIVTTITCISGAAMLASTYHSNDWPVNTKLTTVLKTLVSNVEGLAYIPKFVNVNDITFNKFSHAGKTFDSLNDLARTLGFTWWIEAGIFRAVSDPGATLGSNFSSQRVALVSYKDGMLLRAEPQLSASVVYQTPTGVCFRSMLNSMVKCGEFVQLESNVNADIVNGTWMVQSANHTGDTKGGPWYTDAESMRTFNPYT